MSLATWLLYVTAVLVLTVTPGPSVLLCVSTSIQHGPRRALISSLGSTSAIAGIMLLSMLGLGTVLMASQTLFVTLKWLGAGYLAYLGLTLLFAKTSSINISSSALPAQGARALFARGMLVGASNPRHCYFLAPCFLSS